MKINSNLKESIKSLIDSGCTIKKSYKEKINDWYGEFSIYKLSEKSGFAEYVIHPHYKKFVDADQAVDYFCYYVFSSKNAGYIQQRLNDKGLIDEDDEDGIENPGKKMKALFEKEGKLVDEEFKILNVTLPKDPSKKEAAADFKSIVETFDLNDINPKILEFRKKYSQLDPHINVSMVYDNYPEDGKPHEFFSGLGDHIDIKRVKEEKNSNNKNYKFKHLGISFRLGQGDIKFFKVNI